MSRAVSSLNFSLSLCFDCERWGRDKTRRADTAPLRCCSHHPPRRLLRPDRNPKTVLEAAYRSHFGSFLPLHLPLVSGRLPLTKLSSPALFFVLSSILPQAMATAKMVILPIIGVFFVTGLKGHDPFFPASDKSQCSRPMRLSFAPFLRLPLISPLLPSYNQNLCRLKSSPSPPSSFRPHRLRSIRSVPVPSCLSLLSPSSLHSPPHPLTPPSLSTPHRSQLVLVQLVAPGGKADTIAA